ncbi:MAG: DMT family transporter [Rhodocyclales bacterium]|nr:DMT family transporter [Rhodocyclales bacterium]
MSTPRFYVIGFGALMLFDTCTQISFKLAGVEAGEFVPHLHWLRDILSSPWTWAAVLGYLCAFVTWMTLLKHAPVGPAFAASHLEVVMVLIISVLVFDEKLSLMQCIGGLSIVLGIVCLSMSKAGHPEDA